MSHQVQTPPDTKAGTSPSFAKETATEKLKKRQGVTQAEINLFHDQLILAKQDQLGGEIPWVETTKEMCEHYNRNNLKGFHDAGYFIVNGVKVCIEGTVDEVQKKEQRTTEQVLFGVK